MRSISTWVLSVAALASVAAVTGPAAAQPYGYGDDGPPPFRRGPGWDGPPREPFDHWHHHRRWRDEGFDRRGWRDGGRRGNRERFGDEGDGRRPGGDEVRRERGDGGASRRGGADRNGPRPFGDDGN